MCTTERSGVVTDGGFSLLEVLFAVGVLVVVLAAVPQLFLAAARANVEAGEATWATALAAQKIEELVAVPSPLATDGVVTDYLDQSGAPPDAPERRAYVRRWSVEPLAAAPDRTLVLSVAISRYRSGSATARENARLVTLHTSAAP